MLSWNKYESVSAQLNLLQWTCVHSPELSPSNTGRRTDVARNSSSSSHRGRTRLAIARCRMPPPPQLLLLDSSNTILFFSSMIFWRGCASWTSARYSSSKLLVIVVCAAVVTKSWTYPQKNDQVQRIFGDLEKIWDLTKYLKFLETLANWHIVQLVLLHGLGKGSFSHEKKKKIIFQQQHT